MYKTSIPVSIDSMSDNETEKDLKKYLEYFKAGNIERVFLAVLPGVYSEQFEKDIKSKKLKLAIDFFKAHGMEVGIWIGGFGHGVPMSHERHTGCRDEYTKIVGVYGETYDYGYCPLDESFIRDYTDSVKETARLSPDIIMIDDDFRLNQRSNIYFGCFCEKHLKEYCDILGEEITRERIDMLAFSGGKNKYRDAYMEMARKTLLEFATKIREAIDEVNPNIRAGSCMIPCAWDFEGTDGMEISRAFAGKNKPFLRTTYGPLHNRSDITEAIDNERMEFYWVKDSCRDIEVFSEGDVYPRPRYNVPSKSLELFDLALCCDGGSDGILKYVFDYDLRVGYETGYIDNHISGQAVQMSIRKIFEDKKISGVRIYSELHKVRNWELPPAYEGEKATQKVMLIKSATDMVSKNSLASCYAESEYPTVIFGENARYIPVDELKKGAVLDVVAARILKERGIDTGLVSSEEISGVQGEYYISQGEAIYSIYDICFGKIVCDERAEVLSLLKPYDIPGSYRYENSDGMRFLVFASDFYFSGSNANYFNNYFRQEQLISGIEWAGGKRLPAVCEKHPNLYIMTAKNKTAVSVLLLNIFMDDVKKTKVRLDKAYKRIKCINCDGELKGDMAYLSDIPPFGFAAFEVE